jgi:hypothetical protein
MAKHASNVQDIWYKGQRILRTGFQWLVGSVFPVTAIIGYANDVWGGEVLGGAVVVSGLVTTYMSKLMSDQKVNEWLSTHTFLGSIPKSVAKGEGE